MRFKNFFFEKIKLYDLWLQENNFDGNKIANINEIDFSNRLEEILKQDTFKLLINISINIYNNHITRYYNHLIRSLLSISTNQIILKRKNYIQHEKHLVLRNILLFKEKELGIILKSYFYNWKRIIKINFLTSWDKKAILRKLVNKKIYNENFSERLLRRAFIKLINKYRSFPINDLNSTNGFKTNRSK